MKKYSRDGRSPLPTSDITSRVMSSNKGKDTGPELMLRKALSKERMIGYRLHCKGVIGKPDICYPKQKVAIFVHGCFWHRCPKCKPTLPKSHSDFWRDKFERNVERDKEKITKLEESGWDVVVLWECDVNNNLNVCIDLIKEAKARASLKKKG